MKILLSIIPIFIISCDFFDFKVYNVPEEVEPFMIDFREESLKRGLNHDLDNVDFEWIDSGGTVFGKSNKSLTGTIKLRIDRNFWEYYSNKGDYYVLQGFIFHELGHNPLSRDHISQGESYMNTENSHHWQVMFKCQEDSTYRIMVLDELFSTSY